MKLLFAAEDTIVGMVCGLLLIGLTERFFSLKLPNFAYAIIFAVFIFVILLDFYHEISDLSTHKGFIILSLLHGIVDLIIALTFISFFGSINIPYISEIFLPYLESQPVIFFTGAYLLIGNFIWLIMYFFIN